MELFEGVRTVRLKGSHGKFLWADQDQYTVSQHHEDKNEMAVWRVERVNPGKGNRARVLRFKSCFDTYLTAMDIHHHDVSFLAFSGKKVAQMRAENVDSASGFDWEPVIEHGMLMLKSCFGTWLRANRHAPPWNDTVSHGMPRHFKHEDWLTWEVQNVSAPNVIPLEFVVGPIEGVQFVEVYEKQHHSKISHEIFAKGERSSHSHTKAIPRRHHH